jgi:hypothetical protein
VEKPPPRIEEVIGKLDRRIVYFGLLLLTLLPLVFRWQLPLFVGDPPRRFRDAIEALPTDKVVFISSDWDAGTQAESRPQVVAVLRHLIRRNLKFVLFSISYPTSPALAQSAAEQAIRLENAGDRYRYGEQWVNMGYRLAEDAWLRSLANDISTAMKESREGQAFSEIPVLKGVRKFGPEGQVSMLINVTGSSTIESYYQFLTPTKVQIALGCTAVMAPEQYPFLDSGQLSGLLTGMKGGAEYEQLIEAPGAGLPAMAGQSFAHLYILILILLGNLSVFLSRRRRAR